MTAAHRWIGPFENQRARRFVARRAAQNGFARTQTGDDLGRTALVARELAEEHNRGVDVLEARRLERDDARIAVQPSCGLRDDLVGDRAHRAQFLRDDQIGFELR